VGPRDSGRRGALPLTRRGLRRSVSLQLTELLREPGLPSSGPGGPAYQGRVVGSAPLGGGLEAEEGVVAGTLFARLARTLVASTSYPRLWKSLSASRSPLRASS
jgi:hypothetical protein